MTPTAQSREALAKANATRMARSRLRARLEEAPTKRAAVQVAADVLGAPPGELATVRVGEFLTWCRYVGPAAARALVRPAEDQLLVPVYDREIGRLTHRQTAALARVLRTGGTAT
jgi:hypothetical protein